MFQFIFDLFNTKCVRCKKNEITDAYNSLLCNECRSEELNQLREIERINKPLIMAEFAKMNQKKY